MAATVSEYGDGPYRTHYNGISDPLGWNQAADITHFRHDGQTLPLSGNGTAMGQGGALYFPVSSAGDAPNGVGYLTAWNMAAWSGGQPIESWSHVVIGASNSSPLIVGGSVYVAGGGTLRGYTAGGTLISSDANGNIAAANPVYQNQVVSHPLYADGLIWISSQNGYLWAVSPSTLQRVFAVPIGSRMDGSPTLVYGVHGTPYIAVGTAYAAGNRGGTGTLYLVDPATGRVVSSIPDPTGTPTAIASSPIYTGSGVSWNDLSGNVFWSQIDHGAFKNVTTWESGQSGFVSNEEAAYYGGYYVLPQTSTDKTEVVDLDQAGSPIKFFTNADGADNTGSPEISADNVYVPDAFGDVNSFPVSSLKNPSAATDNTAFAFGYSSSNLTNADEQMLPASNGETVPTLAYETSSGLQIWQNTPKPSVSLSASAATATVGGAVALSAAAVSVPKGDSVEVEQSPQSQPGTLTSGTQRDKNAVSSAAFGFFQPSYDYRPSAKSLAAQGITYTAYITDPSTGQTVAVSQPVTVTWAAAAPTESVTLSAAHTRLVVGHATGLTASAKGLDDGDYVQVSEVGSSYGSLSGYGSYNQSSVAGPEYTGSTDGNYSYPHYSADMSSAATVDYQAQVYNSSGVAVGRPSNTVAVRWIAASAPTLTLSAVPTSTTTGAATTLTVTGSGLPSGAIVYVHDIGPAGDGVGERTLNDTATSGGNNGVDVVSGTLSGGRLDEKAMSAKVLSGEEYVAKIYYNGQYIASNTVSVTWAAASAQTVTLSATSTALTVGQTTAIDADTTGLQTGQQVVVQETVTADNTLSGYGYVDQSQVADTYTGSDLANGSPYNFPNFSAEYGSAGTVTYQAFVQEYYGKLGWVNVASSGTVSVTWSAASVAPVLTLSETSGSTAMTDGQGVTMSVSGTGLDSASVLYIHDSPSGADTIGGGDYASGTAGENPFSVNADSSTSQSVTYYGEIDWHGTYIRSNTITVTWSAAAAPVPVSTPSLTLTEAAQIEPSTTSPDTLTATGSNLTANAIITVTQVDVNGGDTFTSPVGSYAAATDQYYVDPYSGQQLTVSDVSAQNGYSATYSAVATNPTTGQTEATATDVVVYWGQPQTPPTLSMSASPDSLPINQYTTVTVTGTSIPLGDFVEVYPIVNGNWWSQNAVYVQRQNSATGAFSGTFSVTQSQPAAYQYQAVVTAGGPMPQSAIVGANMTAYWTATAGVSLTPSQQTLAVGQAGLFNVNYSYLPSGEQIDIWLTNGQFFNQIWNNTPNAISGTQQEYVPSPNYPTTDGFYAVIAGGGGSTQSTPPSSNYIGITWQDNPTVTMTASPANLFVGQYSQFLLYPHYIPKYPPFMIGIEDVTTQQIIYTSSNTQTTYDVSGMLENTATTQVFAPVVFAAGDTNPSIGGIIYTGPQVSVTWAVPTVTISPSAPSYLVGQQATLNAYTPNYGSSLGNNAYLGITDVGGNNSLLYYWYYPFGYYYQNEISNSGNNPQNPFAGQALLQNASGQPIAGTEQYTGQLYYYTNSGGLSDTSAPTSVTWGTAPSSINLSAASPTETIGESDQLTATTVDVPQGFTVTITDETGAGTLGGSNTATSQISPYTTSATDNHAQAVTYVATLADANGTVVATSAPVVVTWGALPVSLVAQPQSLVVGNATTLTATTALPTGWTMDIVDLSGDDTLSGSNSTPPSYASSQQVQAVDNTVQTVQYAANVYNQTGALVEQAGPVSVQWVASCPPLAPAPAPNPPVSGPVTWSQGPNGTEIATWDETTYTVTETTTTGTSGCPVATYTQTPHTTRLSHTYGRGLTATQITALSYDPGTPLDMWLPIPESQWATSAAVGGLYQQLDAAHGWDGYEQGGPEANQRTAPLSQWTPSGVVNGYQYGYEQGHRPQQWYPLVWARPASTIAMRSLWQGAANDAPTGGWAQFDMVNPDGSYREWTVPVQVDSATWQPQGVAADGQPVPASEYVSAATTLPRHTTEDTVGGEPELAAWSLASNPIAAEDNGAQISVTYILNFPTGTRQVTEPAIVDVATLYNYPVWYLSTSISSDTIG